MVVLEWITAIILLALAGTSGVMKLIGNKRMVEGAEKLGYTNLSIPIGVAEVLGAIGVIIGAAVSDFEWLGVLAAIGIVALMLGALVYHRRAGDTEIAPAIVLIIVAVLYIIALLAN